MTLSFDKFEKYEMPQITLCNPSSRATVTNGKITISDTVGVLSNASGIDLKINFNAPCELSFDYYRHKSNDSDKQLFYDSLYDAIQTDRYIYLTDIGYFVISNVVDSDQDNVDKKTITCKSCEENEFAISEGLYLEEGTYYLHTQDNKGLLDLFLPKTPGWTIGFIDSSLLTKPYYVEETEVDNGYNFLYTTIQNMFECIIEVNIIERTVSVYSMEYYSEHHLTDIHIAKYNLLKYKTVEENDEDKFTALNVQGKTQDVEIRAVNPTGKNIIYNFESRYAWMSSGLQTALTKWQEKCESVEDDYLELQEDYYDEKELLFNEEQNIGVLKDQLKQLLQTQELVVSGDYDKEQYATQQAALDAVNLQIASKQTAINSATASYNSHKASVHTNYELPIEQINADCALDITAVDVDGNAIFTQSLLNELMTHIKPTDYVDEYMIITDSMTYPEKFEKSAELMSRAKAQLVKISSGKKTYSIDTRSFLFNKHFKYFSDQLRAGAIIYVETKNDIMEQVHLTGIDIDYDEKRTNFTLGNKYDKSDLKSLYDDSLGKNSKSFTELKYLASIVAAQEKQLEDHQDEFDNLRTLTLNNVLTSDDQAIEINNHGLTGRKRKLKPDGTWDEDANGNPIFELEQVKLINNTLIFTEDNWATASTAVGKIAIGNNQYAYGINGQVLIGELILGNRLVLTGTSAGIKIKDGSNNDVFYADNNGNLVLSGSIYAQHGQIGNWDIGSNNISYNSNALYFGTTNGATLTNTFGSETNPSVALKLSNNFGVTTAGKLYAKSGNIAGWNFWNEGLNKETVYNNTTYTISLLSMANYTDGTQVNPVISLKVEPDNGTPSWPFVLRKDGSLTATKATITGAITATSGTFSNCTINNTCTITKVDATEGKIGGWTIQQSKLMATGANGKVCAIQAPPASGNRWVFAAGGTSHNSYDNCPFRVMQDGTLYATSAHITGEITATSGTFDNCTINNTCTITKVNATDGTIGGWNINSGAIYKLGIPVSIIAANDQQSTFLDSTQLHVILHPSSGGSDIGVLCPWYWIGKAGQDAQNASSDARLKTSIDFFTDEYEVLFDNLIPRRYKYTNGTSGRYHTGFIAQEIVSAISKANLSTNDFASVCLEGQDEEHGFWYLRRDEIVSLNTWQIQKLKNRVSELETIIVELKARIQTLTAG